MTSIGAFLMAVNTSTLSVALPVVARHFRATATEANWILLSYMLANTVMILVFGRLADIFGRRLLYVGGLTVLTVACLASGLAPSPAVLIGLRVLQAIGGACILSNTTALLADAFPPRLLSTALGLNVMLVSSAQVLGPVVGGFFATVLDWRWVFWFNVPVGAVGVVWAAVTLRKVPSAGSKEPFDLVGAALSLVVIGSLVLALSEGGARGWTAPAVLVAGGCFVVSTPLFLWVQRRRTYPLVDLALFGDRELAMAFLATFLNSVARFATVILVSLYVQSVTGASAFHASLQVMAVAVGMMVASPVAGRIAMRVSARIVSTVGMLATCVSLLALAVLIEPGAAWAHFAVPLAGLGLGSGLFLTPNTSAIMARVRPTRRGIANGLRSMLQNAGMVVSTALGLAIVTSPLSHQAKAAAYAGQLSHLPHAVLGVFTDAYRFAFVLLAILVAAGTVASLLRSSRR
ncbi:MAG: DHA2 family efflux MFS transporter permease subunit [Streptosporangiales bacterium]|nr:DHA2 family efflux MFS transporter permease subunit [Streptosporangiales bacterium]